MAAWLVHHMAFACCLAGGRRCHSLVCEPSMAGAVRGECGMINSTNDASQTKVLTLHDVHKSFGEAHIIRGVDLDLRKGERHAIIGPNGAGKSRLLQLISGLFWTLSGEILLH